MQCWGLFLFIFTLSLGGWTQPSSHSPTSAKKILKQLKQLNKAKKYKAAEKLFDDSKIISFSINEVSPYTKEGVNPADLTSQILVQLYSEYTFSQLKQKKFKECLQTYSSVITPYCCSSPLNPEDINAKFTKPLKENYKLCEQGWLNQFIKHRKPLKLATCDNKKNSFQIKPKTCFSAETILVKSSTDRTEGLGKNELLAFYIKTKTKERVVLSPENKTIPNTFPLFANNYKITFYSDKNPNIIGVLIKGSTSGWEAGTSRGQFFTFGLLDIKQRRLHMSDELQLSLN